MEVKGILTKFFIPKKVVVHYFVIFLDENAKICYENIVKRVVILLNCLKGRKVI